MMKNKMLSIMLVLSVVCLAMTAPASAEFTAYTRCAKSASGYVTEIYLNDADGPGTGSVLLKDFSSGTVTSVTATAIGTANDATPGYTQPASGTDAYNTFNGKLDSGSLIGYGSTGWYCELVFTGLTPSKTYEFASVLSREDYLDRWSVISIVGADVSTYASTDGTFKISETSMSMACNQTVTGHVARWTGIESGDDGEFTIHYTHASLGAGIDIPNGATQNSYKAYGPAGFMLVEIPEPATMSLLAISGIALLRRRKRA
jgi:hypothetical protein